jgi:hypothetical protein
MVLKRKSAGVLAGAFLGLACAGQAAAQEAPGPAPSATPQTATQRAMEQCRRMSSTELQIQCLEAALEAAYRLHGQSGLNDPISAPAPDVRNGATTSDSGAQPVRRNWIANPFRRGTPQSAGEDNNASAAQPAAQPSSLGAEQVAARERRGRTEARTASNSLSARVSRVSVHGYSSLVLTLDNGQVWRQLSADTQRLDPDDADGSPVTVRAGRLNGYLMELEALGRTIRVERLR